MMKMHAFNHANAGKLKDKNCRVLLAVTLVLVLTAIGTYWQLDHQIHMINLTRNESRISALESQSTRAEHANLPSMKQEISSVNQAVYEINAPWLSLLSQLESHQSVNVKLLTLDPDIKQKRVRLVLEAETEDAMAAYIAQITQVKCIQHAVLLNQQKMSNGTAVHFTVEGTWRI